MAVGGDVSVVEKAAVTAVEDALLKEENGVVEIVDLALLDPEQLIALSYGVHQHLLGLHKVLEHERIRRRRGRR